MNPLGIDRRQMIDNTEHRLSRRRKAPLPDTSSTCPFPREQKIISETKE
jgi:hypothetical protein